MSHLFVRNSLLFFSTLCLLVATILTAPANASTESALSANVSKITFTEDSTFSLRIYPSDKRTLLDGPFKQSIYINNKLGGDVNSNYSAVKTFQNQEYYEITVKPITPVTSNGSFQMKISQFDPTKAIFVTIEMNFRETGVSISSDATKIQFTNSEPYYLKVYPSDKRSLGDGRFSGRLILNSKYDNKNDVEPLGVIFDAEVFERTTDYYVVEIKPRPPYRNGAFELQIQQSVPLFNSNVLKIQIEIEFNSADTSLYQVDFKFGCYPFNYGGKLTCEVRPAISGDGKAIASGTYSTRYSYFLKSNKAWSKEKSTVTSIKKDTSLGFSNLKQPIQVRVKIEYQNETFEAKRKIFPSTPIRVSGPTAGSVGQQLTLRVNALSNYSGSCISAFSGFTYSFKISRGTGQVRVVGNIPGQRNFMVTCNSPGWATVSAAYNVYLR